MDERKSKKGKASFCTLVGVSTFSEQYLALTNEERENLLPTIRPDAGLTEEDLAVVIADLQRSDEEFLHVEILKFLSQFPNSPQAKTALLSVLKQEKPDDMVLSHAGQELMFFTLDDDDFDAIYRCLVAIHGDEDYENASESLLRTLTSKHAASTLSKLVDAGLYVDPISTWIAP